MNISRLERLLPALLLATAATAFCLSGPAAAAVYQESGGMVVFEAEEPFSLAAGSNGAEFDILHSGATNFRGDGYLQILPDAGASPGSIFSSTGPIATYKVNIGSSGTYRLWHRANGPDGGGDSVYYRVFKDTPGDFWLTVPATDAAGNFNGDWSNQGRLNTGSLGSTTPIDIPITQGGIYTIQIAQREDGTRVDSLLLDRTGTFAGTDPGPAASSQPTGLVYRETGGQVVIEAEHFNTRTAGASDTYTFDTDGVAGARGGLFMRSGPNNGTGNTTGDLFANGPTLGYDILIETPGTYRAWIRLADNPDAGQPKGNDDSVWVRMYKSSPDDVYLVSQNLGGTWDWQDSGLFTVDRTGVWHFDIAMREDGADIDAIILDSTGTFTGSTVLGPAESAFTIIPEPSTLLVWSLLTGLGIGIGWRRRR